jgi:putative oxidoreductase
MPEFAWRWLLARPLHGNAAWIAGLVRVVLGALFTFGFGLAKFSDHDGELRDFRDWDIPAASVAVYVVGLVELVGGLMLLFGLLTRVASLVLAALMVGAILTAGRVEGFGFHTTVPPLLILALLFVFYAGGGPLALDRVMERRVRDGRGDGGDGGRGEGPGGERDERDDGLDRDPPERKIGRAWE